MHPCVNPLPCLPSAHLLRLEPALDPLVLHAGDGVQEAAAGELQALVQPAVGQPLPVAERKHSGLPSLPAGPTVDQAAPVDPHGPPRRNNQEGKLLLHCFLGHTLVVLALLKTPMMPRNKSMVPACKPTLSPLSYQPGLIILGFLFSFSFF